MTRVKDIYNWIDEYAPFRYAQSWDQCGLQAGDPEAAVERVLVALDPSSETIREARERRCECLVTHHPLIFRPLKALRTDEFPGNLVIEALLRGVHVIAAHTNLDVARDGTNDRLSRLLDLEQVEPLETDDIWSREERYGGMGRTGTLPKAMTVSELAALSKRVLGVDGLRTVGGVDRPVHRVAICTGSGGSLVDAAISSGVDVYITGDVKYHEALRALEAGLALIDVGHFGSERVIVEPLVSYLKRRADQERASLEISAAECERDPFLLYGQRIE
ncbi:MAG: Nif3-like dinuclear metal center hexameric protein [Desulforhabdus sp.]|jgi:dinuclear metal center YbgI/SA1388 family protein|nr:Nif3-like dinuclear metal center hexameric protein [Desulforhabdus sp.]